MHDIAPSVGSVASATSDAEAQTGCNKHGRGMHQLFKAGIYRNNISENGQSLKGLQTVAMKIREAVSREAVLIRYIALATTLPESTPTR